MKARLLVSDKRYKHEKMFGTRLFKDAATNKMIDPCRGDSGGPLMYKDRKTRVYYLIGTLNGGGFNCKTDRISMFEGSNNGLWNKVSAWVNWINEQVNQ